MVLVTEKMVWSRLPTAVDFETIGNFFLRVLLWSGCSLVTVWVAYGVRIRKSTLSLVRSFILAVPKVLLCLPGLMILLFGLLNVWKMSSNTDGNSLLFIVFSLDRLGLWHCLAVQTILADFLNLYYVSLTLIRANWWSFNRHFETFARFSSWWEWFCIERVFARASLIGRLKSCVIYCCENKSFFEGLKDWL